MTTPRQYIIGVVISVACISLVLQSALVGLRAATPEVKPELASLGYFLGEWDCSGKFDVSGKSIEAHQSFTPELAGAWISFRHDDKPPFNYHALSEWGWDAAQKRFVMTAQDSGGGARVFYSAGWAGTALEWNGDTLGNNSAPTQRFTFERIDDHHFKVSYFFLKNGAWSRMDSSTCVKQ